MAKTPQLVIDIGTQSIKVAQVRSSKNGVAVVKVGTESLMLPANADQEKINQRVEETLPILLQRLGIKEKRAVVTLPGRAAFTRKLQVPVVRGRQLGRIIKYEARQHIPFPLEQVNMDYQVSGPTGDSVELDINLVAVRKEIADGYCKILKKCGIQSDIIETAPLSIYNAYAASSLRDTDEVTAIISIGAANTDIVIEQGGIMQFMRTAPVAGSNLTALIAKRLNISPEKAEELKTRTTSQFETSSGEEEPSAEEVASVLEQGFETIVTEIRRSFDFYVSQADAEPVTRVIVCGGTCKMEGVCEFLEDRLGVPVTIFDAKQVESVEVPSEHVDFLNLEATLVGMCVRAAGKSPCALSFAPDFIKNKLELEARMPMLAVMGLLLLVMIAGSWYMVRTMVENRNIALARVNDIIKPTQDKNPQLREARTVQQKYMDRYERINQIAQKRGKTTRVFLEIQNLIPSDIWLEEIEQLSNKSTVYGRALNEERIYAYIQALSMSPFFNNDMVALREINYDTSNVGSSQPQLQFVIDILQFNNPTDEEVKFVEEFRKLTKDQSILLLRFVHEIPDDPRSDSTLMIGVYQMDDEKERISLLNKVLTALNLSKDQSIKKIELRAHNRNNDEVQRLVITREKIEGYRDGSLSDTDFMSAFEMLTPSPSPEPTATPTPESGTAAGGYGMGMGMYGMMGMGGMGGAGGAAPAGQAAPAGDEAIGP